MTRLIARAIGAAVLGALGGAAWLLLFYLADPSLSTDLAVTPPASLVRGLYPVERTRDARLTFAWTGEAMSMHLPGLDRSADWQFVLRARAARPDPATNPALTVLADGILLAAQPSSADFSDLRVTISRRPERPGLTLTVRSSATVVPGPHDRRQLGVMLDAMSLSPEGWAVPPRRALFGAAAATAAAGIAAALLGFGSVTIAAVIIVAGAVMTWPAAHGFGPYTDFPDTLALLAIVLCLGAVLFQALLRPIRRAPLSWAGSFVVLYSALASVMKLAVLLHPDMPVGDAMFQAHRFQTVLGGTLYFTSLAPGNYSFPYAPGLYVFAMPFADLVARGAADMALLRVVVVVVDAAAAAVLYAALVRAGASRLAGVLTVVLYHAVPLDSRIVTVGNLTNAFSQSLAAAALGLMAAPLVTRRALAVLLLTLVLAAAFLSHTSTLAIGSVAAALIAVLFYAKGGRDLRPAAVATAAAVVAAAVAAWLLYYSHFMEVYQTEWTRISAETATAAPDAGGRGIAGRLSSVPRYLHLHLGLPALALASWGVSVLRRDAGTRVALAAGGWALACVLFLVAGIVTPVDMRHYLAVIPAVAIAGGVAAAHGYVSGGWRRTLALVLFGWAIVIYLHTWWSTLPSA